MRHNLESWENEDDQQEKLSQLLKDHRKLIVKMPTPEKYKNEDSRVKIYSPQKYRGSQDELEQTTMSEEQDPVAHRHYEEDFLSVTSLNRLTTKHLQARAQHR